MADGLDRFLAGVAQQDQASRSAALATRNANPDQAAQANVLSRSTGIPADTVERNLGDVSTMQRFNASAPLIASNPTLSSWFANPRNAAAAADDVPPLHAMSTLLGTDTVAGQVASQGWSNLAADPSKVPFADRAAAIRAKAQGTAAAVDAARPTSNPLSWWAGAAVQTVQGMKQAYQGAQVAMDDAMGVEASGDIAAMQHTNDIIQSVRPRDQSTAGGIAYDAVTGVASMVPLLAAGALTGGVGAIGLAGLQGAASSYGNYRALGRSPLAAGSGAVAMGAVDAATMGLPVEGLINRFGEEGTKRFVAKFLAQDLAGMEGQAVAGGAIDTAEDPNATWGDFVRALPKTTGTAAINALVGAGTIGAAHHVFHALAPVERGASDATTALAGANLMDNVMQQAEASKLRQRDPDGYQQFMEQHTSGSPVENVYLPAEKMRELMQSDAFDPRTWEKVAPDLNEQMAQALPSGGDVVLPLSAVATHLAGSDTWEHISQDVRFDPGGQSEREAHDFNTAYADLMEQAGRDAETQQRAETESLAPQQRVFDDVFSQTRQAGFNVRSAQAYAEMWANRYETRAARSDQFADAHEAYKASNVSIRQELPEALGAYRKADDLDLVINAMRRGAAEPKPAGPSMLEYISRNGGIEDRGGDLKSMGADRWHREKAFRGRLLRDLPEDNPAFQGMENTSSGFGIDDWGQRLHDEGYFPHAIERPTTSDVIDAIGDELRGRPRYSEGVGTDQARETQAGVSKAADELRAVLSNAGVDPDKATRAEIETAVNDHGTPREADEGAARGLAQGERGRIDIYADGKNIIRLFDGRDMSTVIHESGHLWLEELRQDAEAPGATDQLKGDWRTVKDWFGKEGHGFDDGEEIPTNAHELWARGVERYVMEGKAPSSALASAFSAFRSWLLRIYQVAGNLRAPITPEVREVMDRMFATDDAIAEAGRRMEAQHLPQDALGMTDAEYGAYLKTVGETRTEAFDALLYRTMEAVRRRRTKEWKAERSTIRDDVAKGMAGRPEFVALAKLRGSGGEERVQLSRQAIVDEYGADALALVPNGVPPTVSAEGGVHPDVLAEMVGLRNGRELMTSLFGIKQRENELRANGATGGNLAFNEAVDQQTDTQMRERHGDVLTDGSIEEEALAAIHSDQRASVLASELRALARKTRGEVPTPLSIAREWARRIVREGLVKDQASQGALARHARSEGKAGRDAEKAILSGDTDAAFKAKQQQQLSNALFREAKAAKDEVEAIVKRLGKLANAKTLPSMDQEYLDRIHDLLESYDFKPRTAREVGKRESFAKWVEAREAAGEEIHIPERLVDAKSTNFSKMKVGDLTALDDMIASIAHLGRKKKQLVVGKEIRDYEDAVNEWRNEAERSPSRKFSTDRNKGTSWVRTAVSSAIRMDEMARQMDNENPNGLATRVMIDGASEAANRFAAAHESVLEPIGRAYAEMPKEQRNRLQERITVPEFMEINPDTMEVQPAVMSRSELMMAALHTGTDSNLDKLIRGENMQFKQMPQHQLTEERLMQALNREFAKADWDFVQKVWDHVGSMWPDIARTEKEMTGVEPEKVDAREVKTAHGTYAGGYMPVVYDPAPERARWANFQPTEYAASDAEKLLGQVGRGVSTAKGHSVTRTDYAAPLLLSLEGVLFNHVRRVASRNAYGPWLRDVLKLTSDPRFRELWNRKLGPEYYDQIKGWLRSQVNGATLNTADIRGMERVLRTARTNATAVGLLFRMSTLVSQAAGVTNSIAEIGPKAIAKGYASAFDATARAEAFGKSEQLSRRAGEFDRDVQNALNNMRNAPKTAVGRALKPAEMVRDRVNAMGFHAIGWMQLNLVDVPTWMGAYGKGVGEGMNEDQAVAYADRSVIAAQGGGLPKDLAAIQRSSEGYKMLSTFYSFSGTVLNYQWRAARDIKRGNYAAAASKAWWVMLAGPILTAALTGDTKDDDESWAAWAAKKIFVGMWTGVPVARELVTGYDATTPLSRVTKAIGQSGKDLFNAISDTGIYKEAQAIMPALPDGGQVSDRWVRHAIESAGYVSGLGTGQAAASIDYGVAVHQGDQQPQDAIDVAAGIMKGRRKDQGQ